MSWQIPTQIELDIIAGKARYQTFQTGNGGQSILPVPPNSYVVIFGYDFSPAGGSINTVGGDFAVGSSPNVPDNLLPFMTQQVSFFTGNDFYPFIHHIGAKFNVVMQSWNAATPDNNFATTWRGFYDIENPIIPRQVYITSTNDVAITVGLIRTALRNTATAIPITNRTPQSLTYGGSPQLINTQTDYGPALTPQNFMQPSTKDYADFAFGLLPNNPDDQAFATPDTANGLNDASAYIDATFVNARSHAAAAYYLCIHYALYSKTVPEQRG
jgi:hypothetical protein